MNYFSLKIIKQIIEKERKRQKRRKREKKTLQSCYKDFLERKEKQINLNKLFSLMRQRQKTNIGFSPKFHLNKCFPSKQIESSSKRNAVALSTISSQ
jgi:hypothetical protein